MLVNFEDKRGRRRATRGKRTSTFCCKVTLGMLEARGGGDFSRICSVIAVVQSGDTMCGGSGTQGHRTTMRGEACFLKDGREVSFGMFSSIYAKILEMSGTGYVSI